MSSVADTAGMKHVLAKDDMKVLAAAPMPL
jgi:hypothetical protein